MPTQIVTPYASLLLEAREGQIAAVPSGALANAKPPTDAELNTFYARNTLRYTVPETRVIRYATFDRSRFVGKVQPTEAEIVAEYKRDAATYAPSEKRVFSQAIVQDQAVAQSISDKVRAGASISSAASAAGFVASKLPAQDKKAMVSFSSQAVADAAFSLPKGGVTAPVKSGLGWHVVQLDSAESSTGKTLDQARGEIITKLSGKKVDDTLADFVSSIEDAAADGTSFDAIAKKESLQVITLPAVTAGGVAPGQPGFKSSEDAAPILADAFKADTSDEPAVVTLPGGKGYAFYHLDRINPAAPKPLADIKQFVVQDFMADRASKAAKRMAEALVAKINGGMGLDEALKSAGVPLPPAKSISALRLQLAQAQGKIPPPLALLFSMAPGKAKLLAADDKQGWYIVKLGKITPGNAAARPDLISATQNEMTRATGEEYVQQFVHAAQASLHFRKDEAAIARVRSALTGSTAK
jgi:peptidyl-prolyl cis-trans isomerase D